MAIPKPKSQKSPKTKRPRKRPSKPYRSLTDRLQNLHLLLRVPSFSRWPLQVRFFCEDVYHLWQLWSDRVNGSIRSGIKVLLDLKQFAESIDDGKNPASTQAKGRRKRDAIGKGGIEGLEVGYSELRDHLEKSTSILAEIKGLQCAVCTKDLGPRTAMSLVCPQQFCRTASHMTCLATKFIEGEQVGALVAPISGRCPGCEEELQWIDLIKDLSLRVRGEKEVTQTMKKPRERKTKVPETKKVTGSQDEALTIVKEERADPDDGLAEAEMGALDTTNDSLPDDWFYQLDEDDDMKSVTSGLSDGVEAACPTKPSSIAPTLPAVIEDSDWDDAEF